MLTTQAAALNSHLFAAIIGTNSFAIAARYSTLAAVSRQMAAYKIINALRCQDNCRVT